MQNGAEYHGDLTKSVTHLIAATATGKKYDHAVNWRMKIVSWEWFEESRQRGMALDENCYDPRMAVEDRGKGAWDRRLNRSPTPLGKRTRDTEPSLLVNPLRRKLRRAASSRMGTQSEALWAGITAAGLDVTKNVHDDWTEGDIAKQTTLREDAVPRTVAVATHSDAQPVEDPASQHLQPLLLLTNSNHGIFEGRVVFAHGFDIEKVCLVYPSCCAILTYFADEHLATTSG
jgi:DNA replication regulator DPB11